MQTRLLPCYHSIIHHCAYGYLPFALCETLYYTQADFSSIASGLCDASSTSLPSSRFHFIVIREYGHVHVLLSALCQIWCLPSHVHFICLRQDVAWQLKLVVELVLIVLNHLVQSDSQSALGASFQRECTVMMACQLFDVTRWSTNVIMQAWLIAVSFGYWNQRECLPFCIRFSMIWLTYVYYELTRHVISQSS